MKENKVEQWEYMEYPIWSEPLSKRWERERGLNKLGEDGWEVYAVDTHKGVRCSITNYYLKRKKGGAR